MTLRSASGPSTTSTMRTCCRSSIGPRPASPARPPDPSRGRCPSWTSRKRGSTSARHSAAGRPRRARTSGPRSTSSRPRSIARKPGGPAFHPEFQQHFSAAFDDLIPIEVAEIRERRNRYLHEQAKPLFDSHREKDPAAVREFENILNQPPYNLTPPESDPYQK